MEKHRASSKKRRNKHRLDAIKLLGNKCIECGNSDNRVLEFDHLRDKETNLSKLFGKKWERVLVELEKCELVCSNCHAIRTWERMNNDKSS